MKILIELVAIIKNLLIKINLLIILKKLIQISGRNQITEILEIHCQY